MNIKIEEIDKVMFKINGNIILETNHHLKVGKSINFYDNNNQVIQLKKENDTLRIEIKIDNIKSCLKKKIVEQEESEESICSQKSY